MERISSWVQVAMLAGCAVGSIMTSALWETPSGDTTVFVATLLFFATTVRRRKNCEQ